MKTLTVRQPWAWAIFHGKPVENRSNWHYKHTGALAIHAGLHIEGGDAFDTVTRLSPDPMGMLGAPNCPAELGVGGLIGAVRLDEPHWWEDCRTAEGLCSPWAQRDQWHLPLAQPRVLPRLIECRGRQGLWVPPRPVLDQLRAVIF